MQYASFHAMNCDVEVFDCTPGAGRRILRCGAWLAAFESRFSRFLPASELARLNQGAGEVTPVSPAMLTLLRLSLELAQRSGGLFDPTILHCLEATGYDRSFEDVGEDAARVIRQAAASSWREVQVDVGNRTVKFPPATGIDFGGIGKGWTVDRLARYVGLDCLVNAGGDLYASGVPVDRDSWQVGVQDPFNETRDLMMLAVRDRGVATSSRLKRRWIAEGGSASHLIDPRTGVSTASDAVQVTAIAASVTLAEFHAKVALLLGVDEGMAYLNAECDVEGLIVAEDGGTYSSAGIEAMRIKNPILAQTVI